MKLINGKNVNQSELISIIIPTLNSGNNLRTFFESCLNSTYVNFEVIINDSVNSHDKTMDVVNCYQKRGIKITYLRKNEYMGQARNLGASYAKGGILLHADSDMKLSKNLLEEINNLFKSHRYDALVILESSYGETFWAKCKWLEKKCYEGNEKIESIRAIKKEVYNTVGGHDLKMIFSEDKDLDLRIRQKGYRVGRTTNYIYHNEGEYSIFNRVNKKRSYVKTINLFKKKHPEAFKWQVNIINRYIIYFKNIKYLFRYPAVYIGMIILKTFEFIGGGVEYLNLSKLLKRG